MRRVKSLIVGLSAALVFAVVAALFLRFMPRPLKPVDAMVVGTVATMAALAVLFVGYMLSTQQRNVLYKKRTRVRKEV